MSLDPNGVVNLGEFDPVLLGPTPTPSDPFHRFLKRSWWGLFLITALTIALLAAAIQITAKDLLLSLFHHSTPGLFVEGRPAIPDSNSPPYIIHFSFKNRSDSINQFGFLNSEEELKLFQKTQSVQIEYLPFNPTVCRIEGQFAMIDFVPEWNNTAQILLFLLQVWLVKKEIYGDFLAFAFTFPFLFVFCGALSLLSLEIIQEYPKLNPIVQKGAPRIFGVLFAFFFGLGIWGLSLATKPSSLTPWEGKTVLDPELYDITHLKSGGEEFEPYFPPQSKAFRWEKGDNIYFGNKVVITDLPQNEMRNRKKYLTPIKYNSPIRLKGSPDKPFSAALIVSVWPIGPLFLILLSGIPLFFQFGLWFGFPLVPRK